MMMKSKVKFYTCLGPKKSVIRRRRSFRRFAKLRHKSRVTNVQYISRVTNVQCTCFHSAMLNFDTLGLILNYLRKYLYLDLDH
jgi:hypothetical protein